MLKAKEKKNSLGTHKRKGKAFISEAFYVVLISDKRINSIIGEYNTGLHI